RDARRLERAQSTARLCRGSSHRRTARASSPSRPQSDGDRGRHRRCDPCVEAEARRRCAGGHQVDGSDDRKTRKRQLAAPPAVEVVQTPMQRLFAAIAVVAALIAPVAAEPQSVVVSVAASVYGALDEIAGLYRAGTRA